MPYTVYSWLRSGALIVECALAEIGAEFTAEIVNLRQNAQRDLAYQSVNPQRKIPTLITPEGETLTETMAICLALDERHPEANLLPPRGSPDREKALRWLAFCATEIYPIVEILDYPERFSPTADTAPGVRAMAVEIWRKRLLLAEAEWGDSPYLLGEQFCLTDLYLAVISRWGYQDDWRPANVPRIKQLCVSVAARPKIASVWQRHWAGK